MVDRTPGATRELHGLAAAGGFCAIADGPHRKGTGCYGRGIAERQLGCSPAAELDLASVAGVDAAFLYGSPDALGVAAA